MPTTESSARTLRFSVFEVDLQAAELRKHGVRVKLQDQPFRILSQLLEHPGDIVTREELRHELWHDQTFVDFDRSLNKAMAKLRSALGDSAETPRYIETIPRHGYRLLVPVANGRIPNDLQFPAVVPIEPPIASPPTATPRDAAKLALTKQTHPFYFPTKIGSSSLAIAIVLFLVILLGLLSFRWRQPTALDGAATVSPRRSVAVLGFRNLSGNSHDAWLSPALADWLGTELSVGDQLRSVPAENVARMKMELPLPDLDSLGPESLARIRKDLGTDLVIAGSYAVMEQKTGREIRLDLRLLDAKTGEATAAFSETGADTNLFALVSKIGERLRGQLGVRGVTSEEAAEVAVALPSSPEAAKFYSQGLERLHVFDALTAQDLLLKAVAKEPNFSLSHAALATAWSQLGYDEHAKTEAKKAYDRASSLSRRERLQVEGRYHETAHEWDRAIDIYRALFEFFPDNVDYGLALSSVQVSAGRGKDALATLAQLRQLPSPQCDDPRIDLEEDHVVESQGDFKSLLSSATAAAEKAGAMGATLLQARALTDQGWALENLGAPDGVESVVRKAEQLYLDAHDERGVATAATVGGIASQMQGDYQAARKQYERSLAIYRQIGYRFGVANEFDNFGDIDLALGDLARARKSYEESLKTYLEIGHIDGEALAMAGLGEVFLREGNTSAARKMLEQSLQICRQIGDRSKEGAALSGLGRVLRMEGNAEAAWNDESEAKNIFDEIGDKSQSGQIQVSLADLLLDESKSKQAADLARLAVERFEKTKAAKDTAAAYLALSRALLEQGKLAQARSYVERTMETAKRSHTLELELSTAIVQARIRAASGKIDDRNEAIRILREISGRASINAFSELALEARFALGQLEITSGNQASGRFELAAVEREAVRNGFGLLARKSAAALGPRNI